MPSAPELLRCVPGLPADRARQEEQERFCFHPAEALLLIHCRHSPVKKNVLTAQREAGAGARSGKLLRTTEGAWPGTGQQGALGPQRGRGLGGDSRGRWDTERAWSGMGEQGVQRERGVLLRAYSCRAEDLSAGLCAHKSPSNPGNKPAF